MSLRLWKYGCCLGVAGALIAAVPMPASAQAVITSGPVSLGVQQLGNLGVSGIGVTLAGVGDGITPGCLCEGWGVGADGIAGYANTSAGTANLTLDAFVSTAASATSSVHLTSLPTLSVTQTYAPSVGAPTVLFEDIVTITNTGAAIADLRYRRVMDWDIPPTVFSEGVTVAGLPASAVIFVNDNGFDSANPYSGTNGDIAGCGTNVNFTDCGPFADHGAHFDLAFGALASGATKTFSVFYGATYGEVAALAALAAVGAEVYSFGQHEAGLTTGLPGTYIWAFKGVGGTPVPDPTAVPEPATLSLLGIGLVAAGYRKLRRV
jgi:hypothetical protein